MVCFCHMRYLVMVIPRSRCSYVAISCWFAMWSCVVCCCGQYALLNICQHWSSSAICSPSALACWGPLVIQEPHSRTLSCDRVLCHQQILIFFLTIPLSRSLMQMRKSSWPRTFLCGIPDVSGIQLLKVWFMQTPGGVLVTSSGFIGLHYLTCMPCASIPLQEAFHVVPSQIPLKSPGKWGPLLCCYPRRRCQWRKQKSLAGLLRSYACFLSHVESHL